MGTIKIEFELPNFERELNVNITLKKDGEVIYTTTEPVKKEVSVAPTISNPEPVVKKKSATKKVENPAPTSTMSGNFMGLDF